MYQVIHCSSSFWNTLGPASLLIISSLQEAPATETPEKQEKRREEKQWEAALTGHWLYCLGRAEKEGLPAVRNRMEDNGADLHICWLVGFYL